MRAHAVPLHREERQASAHQSANDPRPHFPSHNQGPSKDPKGPPRDPEGPTADPTGHIWDTKRTPFSSPEPPIFRDKSRGVQHIQNSVPTEKLFNKSLLQPSD